MTVELETEEVNKSSYPDSVKAGIPKLAPTPKGWEKAPLKKYLYEVRRPAKLVADELYKLVTVRRSRGGAKQREWLHGNQIKTKTQFFVEEGDFLISKRQIVHGACAVVPHELNGAIVSNEYGILHSNGGIEINYLKYLSHTPYFQQTCFHSSIGVHVEKMIFRINKWLEWEFNIPPIGEQIEITKILNTLSSVIESLEDQINAKHKHRQSLANRLLAGKQRFSEFIKTEELHTTKFGQIPVDWGYVPIGKIAKHVSVKNNGGRKLPVLSCTKHSGLVDSAKYFGKRVYSENLSTYKIVRHGTFAYATNHIEEGSIGYQNLYDEAVISPMYTAFQTTDAVDDDFLFKLLKTELYRHIFEVSTSASVDRRGSLRWPEFQKIHIPLPSLPEQRKIATVLSAADREIDQLTQKLDAYKQQKKGLMQQLLTGKKRVKLDHKEAA